MPLKKKSAGKKGKKSKGKKGKKKSTGKARRHLGDQDGIAQEVVANTKVWEMRLGATESARKEYREVARQLVAENESLQSQMVQSEQDTLDVVAFLKQEGQSRDEQLIKLQQQLKDLRRENRKEHEDLLADFSQQLNRMEEELSKKNEEIEVMNAELKLVKEFRKKRALMQKELDEAHEALETCLQSHQQQVAQMEHQFLEEKTRLEQETQRKLKDLAERAHNQAMSNLDETRREVFVENVRLTEALKLHMAEESRLKKERDELLQENKKWRLSQEQQKHEENHRQRQLHHQKLSNEELQKQVRMLEQALTHMVREFSEERRLLREETEVKIQESCAEVKSLQQILRLREKEMNQVKILSRQILAQRTCVEEFFLEALAEVQQEITRNREQYRKDAHAAYQARMLAATCKEGPFPPVRTFRHHESSTNTVFEDMDAAARWSEKPVSLKELTWEQKENVLQLLFLKMNRSSAAVPKLHLKPLSLPTLPQLNASPKTSQLCITPSQLNASPKTSQLCITLPSIEGDTQSGRRTRSVEGESCLSDKAIRHQHEGTVRSGTP